MKPTKIYTFTLAANATMGLLVSGEYFKIMSATGAVRINAPFGELDDLIAGQGLENTPFDKLSILNKTAATNTVRMLIGDRNFIDGMTGSISVSSGSVAVTSNKVPQSGSFVNVNGTVTNASAQLLAANASRQYLLIQNKDSAGSIYINFGAAATVANGVLIGPGGAYELTGIASTQAINAIGSLASNANIVTVEG